MLTRRFTPILTTSSRSITSQHRAVHHQQKQVRLLPNSVFQLNNQIRKPDELKVMTATASQIAWLSSLDCIIQTQNIVGHKSKNILHLWEALQAPGSFACLVAGRDLSRGNERMAIVSDSALQTALVGMWFETGQQKGLTFTMYIWLSPPKSC